MTQRHKIRPVLGALLLLVMAFELNSCGDDSKSSRDDRGVYGDMADALQSTEDSILTANDALYASAAYMQPFIAALLDLTAANSVSASVPQSCLVEELGGRTYTINGEPFTSVVDPDVLGYTARFRLFRLSNVGQPLLDQDIGHIDFTCVDVGVPLTEVQLFSDSILVATTTYSPTSGNIVGTLRSPDASESMMFFGEPTEQAYIQYRFVRDEYEIYYAIQSLILETTSLVDLTISAAPVGTAPETFFDVEFWVDSLNQVVEGNASYTESPIMRGAACINSGTIDSPAFSKPTPDCFSPDVPLLSTNSAQRDAMLEIYQSARAYWLRASAQAELCRSLSPEDD